MKFFFLEFGFRASFRPLRIFSQSHSILANFLQLQLVVVLVVLLSLQTVTVHAALSLRRPLDHAISILERNSWVDTDNYVELESDFASDVDGDSDPKEDDHVDELLCSSDRTGPFCGIEN